MFELEKKKIERKENETNIIVLLVEVEARTYQVETNISSFSIRKSSSKRAIKYKYRITRIARIKF